MATWADGPAGDRIRDAERAMRDALAGLENVAARAEAERSARGDERTAAARRGELGPDWQRIQMRIDTGRTTLADVFGGRDTSPEAERLRGAAREQLAVGAQEAEREPDGRAAELRGEAGEWVTRWRNRRPGRPPGPLGSAAVATRRVGGVVVTVAGVHVPPWSAWAADQPTIVLHARCHPDQMLDAVVAAARNRRWRVTVPGEYRVQLSRGMRGGGLLAEVLQLGLLLPIHRVEVEASLTTPRAPDACAVLVTCTTGAREPRVATSVARTLCEAVGRLTTAGVQVDVDGWYAHPADASNDPPQP